MPSLSPTEREVVRHLLEEAHTALERGEPSHARACLGSLQALAPRDAEVALLEASLAWEAEGPRAAIAVLEPALLAHPDDPELHHALGSAWAEDDGPGSHDSMVTHWLETLRLDAAADAGRGIEDPRHVDAIERAAREVLERIPADLAERLEAVPVVLETRPTAGIVAEGFDPRALGLFEGPDDRGLLSEQVATRPTRIVLFTANLLASFHDAEELAHQVEVTILHELGHYFGLDEEEVARLGLA